MISRQKNRGFRIMMEYTRRKIILLLPFLLIFISSALTVTAAEIQTKSYPLAFHVDLRYLLPTSLYIKCNVKEYNMSFQDFADKEKGLRESRFKEILLTMRDNDVEKCLDMFFREPGMSEKDANDRVKMELHDWRYWWFGTNNLAGKNLEKLKVFNQFYIGKRGVFTYGVEKGLPPEFHPSRLTLRFVTTEKDEFLLLTGLLDAIGMLLSDRTRQAAIFPEKYVPLKDKKFQYEIPIPNTEDTKYPAYIQFNGERYNFSIFSDEIDSVKKTTDEVVKLFQKKYLMVKEGSPREALAEFYTDRSKEKYLEWIKNPESKNYLEWSFKDWATTDRIVRFVVDADPLYIVFHQLKEGSSILSYAFMIRDPKDGKLKFTNLDCIGALTELLNDKEFKSSLSELIIGDEEEK